jgi:XRE family transcriptional regulator, regulator of sulfur utilization
MFANGSDAFGPVQILVLGMRTPLAQLMGAVPFDPSAADGQRMLSIGVLWKIAEALSVSFGSLTARRVAAAPRSFVRPTLIVLARALTAFGVKPRVEIYEPTIASGHLEKSQAHAPGTSENILVVRG